MIDDPLSGLPSLLGAGVMIGAASGVIKMTQNMSEMPKRRKKRKQSSSIESKVFSNMKK